MCISLIIFLSLEQETDGYCVHKFDCKYLVINIFSVHYFFIADKLKIDAWFTFVILYIYFVVRLYQLVF